MRSSLLFLAACLCAHAQPPAERLARLYQEYFDFGMRQSPERATSAGIKTYNSLWSDYSPAAEERRKLALLEFQKAAQVVDASGLPEADRLNQRLFLYEIEARLRVADTRPYLFSINHFAGPHLAVSETIRQMPARDLADYEAIVARLEALPKYAESVIAAAGEGLKRKVLAPKLTAELMVRQLDAQMRVSADESPLLAPFRNFPQSIPEADRARLRARAEAAYTGRFQPAWRKLREYVSNTYLPATRATIGLSENFNGAEMYRIYVRNSTTTRLTPAEIHETGLREMKRIQDEMAAIRKELNFTGSAEEFDAKVLGSPRFRFHSEREILVHGRDIAKRIDPELPRLFKVLPRMPYGVRAIPPDRARTAAPNYQPPALDGSRAGFFYLRTVDPETQSSCCMAALILHEAAPGHHLQIALAREMPNVPAFRRLGGYTAFTEGWGLYAETLGGELGVYDTPYERYGKLQQEIMRAARLVVDTGIHALGWPREKALEAMLPSRGGWITSDFLSSEVDRYIANPSQALAYKIGGLKIEELRHKAEAALGARFDVRDFHDAVLRNGALPLDVLEEQIDAYIAAAGQR